MKLFQDVPGLEDELQLVRQESRALCEDHLFREPLSSVLSAVFSVDGKLLRPALVLLFGRFGPEQTASSIKLRKAGVIIELTHMASLIHDDIVDDAPTRRGRPSIQSVFGKDIAVYGGDYLLSRVLQLVTDPDMSEAGGILSRTISDMCSGEMSQHQDRFNTETDENRYFANISGKTAALFSAACEIGALLAGCTGYTNSIAGRFGHSMGILFQLRDDLLDCLPLRENQGKPQGMDFINGIYTLPVIYSFADPVQGPLLRKLAGNAGEMDPAVLDAQVCDCVAQAGGLEYTRWMMKQYRERAIHALSQMPTHKVKLPLASLLDELMDC